MAFTILRHFKSKEFEYPDLCNPVALQLLDEVREQYGKPLIVTDDARIAGDIPTGGSLTSLHYKGQAFDIRVKDINSEDLWRLNVAVINVATWVARGNKAGVEFEIVWGEKDHHIHLGFFLGDGRKNRLIIKTE